MYRFLASTFLAVIMSKKGKEITDAQAFKMLQSVAAYGTFASLLMDKRVTKEQKWQFCFDRFHGANHAKENEKRVSVISEMLKGEGRFSNLWVSVHS